MSLRTSILGLLAAGAALAPTAFAGDFAASGAEILGEVKTVTGVAQMGAMVRLYNRYDQVVREVLTNDQGRFAFASLPADLYSVRVTLASFMPALRRNIAVGLGADYMLRINLASVLSTVELASLPTTGSLLSDDWKWVLRSSSATRPVLRLLPQAKTHSITSAASVFSQASGMVRVSAGDGESFGGGTQQDVGTAFSVAALLRDSGSVRVSGSFGHLGESGTQSAAFRATYSAKQDGAQVALTVRQTVMPSPAGSGATDESGLGPALRTASLSVSDHTTLDNLRLDYGFNLETVSYLRRIIAASPFARASYDMGNAGMVRAAFSEGTRPAQLISRDADDRTDSDSDLAALALLPRVSRNDRTMAMERLRAFEIGYQRSSATRSFSADAYREEIGNAAFSMSGAPNPELAPDLLPDLDSRSFIFNAGNLYRSGVEAAASQRMGDHIEVTAAAGVGGAIVSGGSESASPRAGDIRSTMQREQRPWATLRASASVPGTRTRLGTSYGWTDFRVLMPTHYSLTGRTNQDMGWNAYIRQPIPFISGRGGRIELSAEVRNLLAQGYLPLNIGGTRSILTTSPRALRGGLSYIF